MHPRLVFDVQAGWQARKLFANSRRMSRLGGFGEVRRIEIDEVDVSDSMNWCQIEEIIPYGLGNGAGHQPTVGQADPLPVADDRRQQRMCQDEGLEPGPIAHLLRSMRSQRLP